MRIITKDNNTIIENVIDFDLSQTLECGQCFRFYKQDENDYVIVAYEKLLHIKQEDNNLIFYNTNEADVESIWIPYFDLERDYQAIKSYLLKNDDNLKQAIDEKYGVRILNQEFHEMLISFIISQNKQIPHIKQIVKQISENYGVYLGEINGEKYYSFPSTDVLGNITEEEYRNMKTGFRAPYLFDASQKLANKEVTNSLKELAEADALEELIKIKGVGNKVANCVMLFSLGFRSSFPIDVWIKRIMETLHFDGKDTKKEVIYEKALELYGDFGGYAQQYLFCYGRDNKIGTKK